MACRKGVWNRDRGICARCGCDCVMRMRILRKAWLSLWRYADMLETNRWRGRDLAFLDWHFVELFGPVEVLWLPHAWEADHIIEKRAGGSNALSNLQTLCIPCHRRKTAEYGKVSPKNSVSER